MNRDQLFAATLQIVAATVAGAKGTGLHDSDELVAKAVRLAKKTAIACDDNLQADEDERVATLAELADLKTQMTNEVAAHAADRSALEKARAQLAILTAPPLAAVPGVVGGDPAIVAGLQKAADDKAKAPAAPPAPAAV